MHIVLLNGALPQYNFGLGKVNRVITETLQELEVNVSEVNLPLKQIPFYDGIRSEAATEVASLLKQAEGIIFATTVSQHSYGAALQGFIEHLAYNGNAGALTGKNCMLVLLSTDGQPQAAMAYYAAMLHSFGANDAVRLALSKEHVAGEGLTETAQEMTERLVEDYYRMVRQSRPFVLPVAHVAPMAVDVSPIAFEQALSAEALSFPVPEKPKVPVSDVYKKLKLDEFNEKQEEDINEIARFFAGKYEAAQEDTDWVAQASTVTAPAPKPKAKEAAPRTKTCHQLTKNLPHYFQPQLATGLEEVIQLFITGEETVTGYYTIEQGECVYQDGTADAPDITILADTQVWTDVLKGKVTAQKAFMVGQLKVRGNFVLLTKFDQLFKTKGD